MAIVGMGSLDCRRILVFALLALAAVARVQGTPESHADESEDPSPSPSVHDCRYHVEAALREYWTRRSESPLPQSKPTDQPQNLTEDPPPDSQPEQNEDDELPQSDQPQEDEDDNDQEEESTQEARAESTEDDDDDDDDEDDELSQYPGDEPAKEDKEDSEDDDKETQLTQEQDDDDDDDDKDGDDDDDDDDDDDETPTEDQTETQESTEDEEEHATEDALESEEHAEKDDDDDDDDDEDETAADEEGEQTSTEKEEEEVTETPAEDDDDDDKDEGDEGTEAEDEQQDDADEDDGKSDSETEMLGDESKSAEEPADDGEEEGPESAQQADDVGDDEGSPDEPTSEESDASLQEPSEESDLSEAGVEQELPSEPSEAEQSEAEDDSESEKEGGKEPAEEDEEVDVVEEEETEEEKAARRRKGVRLRSRRHIDDILGIHEMGSDLDEEEQKLTNSILKELKKLYETAIRPLESTYKYRDISTRLLGEAEVFAKPTVLFVGPWSAGKSTIINFLLGTEFTHTARKTGPELTDTDFTIVAHGDKYQTVSGTELAADWAFSGIQKFGQDFLDHVHGVHMPNKLLQRVTLVDTPGIIETRKQADRGYPFNDAFQWFIDRADAIYVVFDPSKLEIGAELEAILDQLKGRESQVRFILNKADSIQQNEIMKVVGQLMWNLSPLMGSSEAPVIFAASLTAKPFQPRAPLEFLLDQEMSFLEDLKETIDKRVENRIAYARRHAVRVRNHAKMVDCYLSTYYKHKSIFANKKKVAQDITENPNQYSIYQGLSSLSNVSRYDLPDPEVYKEFFQLNPLYEFKPISSTCTYFRGCPLDKLDIAIAYELPELLGKYKKHTKTTFYVQEREAAEEESR